MLTAYEVRHGQFRRLELLEGRALLLLWTAIIAVGALKCGLPRAPNLLSHVDHVVSCPGLRSDPDALERHAQWIQKKFQGTALVAGTRSHALWTGFTVRLPARAKTQELYKHVLLLPGCKTIQPSVRVQHAPFTVDSSRLVDARHLFGPADGLANSTTSAAPWGIQRLSQPHLPLLGQYSPVFNGSGINVFIVDSGLDTTHDEFRNGNGRPPQGHGKTRTVRNLFDLYAQDPLHPSDNNDRVGHGTHVAATIGGMSVGVSPECNLYGVRVLDAQGSGYDKEILAGLIYIFEWFHAAGKPPTVINMSLGGPCLSYEKCASNVLVEAVEKLSREGIKVVVAAGNEGCDSCLETPAFAQSAITTGASNQQDEAAFFSDKGKCLDVFAPGINITSACTVALNPSCVGGGHYIALSGTSMAAPHASGVVAQILQAFRLRVFQAGAGGDEPYGLGAAPHYRYNYTKPEVLTALLCTAVPLVLEINAPYRYGSSLSRNYLLQVPFTTDGGVTAATADIDRLECDLQQGCDAFDFCSNRGVCQNNKCLCDAMFWGTNCSSAIFSEQCDETGGGDARTGRGSVYAPYTLFDRSGSGSGWSGSVFAILALRGEAAFSTSSLGVQERSVGRVHHSRKNDLKMPRRERPHIATAKRKGQVRSLQDNIDVVLQTNLCAGYNETSGICLEAGEGQSYVMEVQADKTGTAPYAGWAFCGVIGGAPARWGVAFSNNSVCSLRCQLPVLNLTLAVPVGSTKSFTYRLVDVSSGQWLASGSWVDAESQTRVVGGVMMQTHSVCIPPFILEPPPPSPALAPLRRPIIGGCRGTHFGCCADGLTPRSADGSSCPPQSILIAAITHGSPDEPATVSLCGLPARNFTTTFVFLRLTLQANCWDCAVVPNALQSPAAMSALQAQNVTEERIEFGIFNARPLDFSLFYQADASASAGGGFTVSKSNPNPNLTASKSNPNPNLTASKSFSSSAPVPAPSGGVLAMDSWHSSRYELVGVDAFAGVAMGNGSLFNSSLEGGGRDHLLVALCPMNMSVPVLMNVREWRLLVQSAFSALPLPGRSPAPSHSSGAITVPTMSPTLFPSAAPTEMPTRNYSAYQSGEKTVYEDTSTAFWMTCGEYGPINEDAIKFKRSPGRGPVAINGTATSLYPCERSCLSLTATDSSPSAVSQKGQFGSSSGNDGALPVLSAATAALLASDAAIMMLSLSSSTKLVSLQQLKATNSLCLGNFTNYNTEVCYRMVLGGGTLLASPAWEFCGLPSALSSTAVVDFCVQDFTKCKALVVEDGATACLASDDKSSGDDGGSRLGPGKEKSAQDNRPPPPPGAPQPPVLHSMYVLMFAISGDGWHGAEWYIFRAPLISIFSSPPPAPADLITMDSMRALWSRLGAYWRLALTYLDRYAPPPTPNLAAEPQLERQARAQSAIREELADDQYLDDDLVVKTDRAGYPLVDHGSLPVGKQTGYSNICLMDGCYLFDVSLGAKPREVEFVLCGQLGEAGSQGVLKIVNGKCLLLDSLVDCYRDDIKRIARWVIAFVAWSFAIFVILVTSLVVVMCRRPAGMAATMQQQYQLVAQTSSHGASGDASYPGMPGYPGATRGTDEAGVEMGSI